MSLQLIAKQMEAKGRKGDSMLVHMTPGEVDGLQKLAEAAGGSLSVNPETGLVEANFLKRMLPTLVGLGVGAATMNPYAGAAAGAAVGGYQARRNDQDVLLGAAMGGLGGYGGASLGAGLTAAGAPTVANVAAPAATVPSSVGTSIMNPATMGTTAGPGITLQGVAPAATTGVTAAPLTASQGLSQAGQGISALGTDPLARGAFMSKVGGGAGLVSDIGMATAPMMAPGKMEEPEEFVEDDEMYYTEYNPGQTGERSSTSTEERQFAGTYSPMERINADDYTDRVRRRNIYAAEGGLMRLAEGGAVAGNSGASADAMSYLMGQAPSASGAPSASQAGLQYLMGQTSRSPVGARQTQAKKFIAPKRSKGTIDKTKGYTKVTEGPNAGMYEGAAKFVFDPASQKYYRTDKLFKYVPPPPPEPVYDPYQGGGGGGGGGGGEYSGYSGGSGSGGGRSTSTNDYDAMGGWEGTVSIAQGGLLSLAKGGMKSGGFVIPADVVSMVGEGNTDAGYSRIKSMVPGATAIKGKDGGQADTVKTSIEGKQPARVAHGEMYIPPETVKRMGGAKKLYAMMDRVREQATGSKKQIKPVSLKRAMA
jgi:hypothetical protein